MEILIKIIYVILSIIGLLLVAALFTPKTYTVSVSEIVDCPKEKAFDYVRYLGNQKNYSIWLLADPTLVPEIIGEDGKAGVMLKWDSKNKKVGAGEIQIAAIDDKRINLDLHFIRPFKGNAKAATIVESLGENQSRISSEFYGDEKFPFNLPAYLFGRKYMRDAQTQNLQNLKQILES